MISAPGVARARCTTGPAATSDSLLASPSRLPASKAARVTGRPAKPTTPLITVSASRAAAAMAPSPAINSVPAGSRSAKAGACSASAMATASGRNSRACSASRSTERAAPSAATR